MRRIYFTYDSERSDDIRRDDDEANHDWLNIDEAESQVDEWCRHQHGETRQLHEQPQLFTQHRSINCYEMRNITCGNIALLTE